MRDVMLDLETMGNTPNSAIVQIGAVQMDLDGGKVGDTFFANIRLGSCIESGLEMSESTVLWWLQQTEAARKMFSQPAMYLGESLMAFGKWLPDHDEVRIWGNGSPFDNVILRNAYTKIGITAPWHFYNDRCYRTVKNLHPQIEHTVPVTAHCALDDAVAQADHLIRIWREHYRKVRIAE